MPWENDDTNVPLGIRYPFPTTRINNYRNTLSTPGGTWTVYLGDLHAHSRGHDDPDPNGKEWGTPNINRTETYSTAWLHGYDFFAITNHSTSDTCYDWNTPISQPWAPTGSTGNAVMMALNGMEDYVKLGGDRMVHSNSFNKLLDMNDSIDDWHKAIGKEYSDDPLDSVHIQLNHPDPEPGFYLPEPGPDPSDAERRRKVRAAIELAEYSTRESYMDLLRRGFRVSPVSNSDAHAIFRELAWQAKDGSCMDKKPDGSWVHPYCQSPGVPRELWIDQDHRRTGLVLPSSEPFNYQNILRAMRARRTFRTSIPKASGFSTFNGWSMGGEISLSPAQQRRLGIHVVATTKDGSLPTNAWRRLELWTPFQPDKPVLAYDYTGSGTLDINESFHITPFHSIYFIRLFQEAPEKEVVLAPIWISNPAAPLSTSFANTLVTRGMTACLNVTGGGESVLLQQLLYRNQDNEAVWNTVASYANDGACIPVPTAQLSRNTVWRVVDDGQEQVASNESNLQVLDAIAVQWVGTRESIFAGRTQVVHWDALGATGTYVFSYSTDSGLTWTQAGSAHGSYGDWIVPTAGLADKSVLFRVRNSTYPAFFGMTPKVFIPAAPQLTWSPTGRIPGQFCVPWREDKDYDGWDNNYLCSTEDYGIEWSQWGELPGMRCTQIAEDSEPGDQGWDNNYLCVPRSSPLRFTWSNADPIIGRTCLQVFEADDLAHTWHDNYLCY